jgi:hypothetical protein
MKLTLHTIHHVAIQENCNFSLKFTCKLYRLVVFARIFVKINEPNLLELCKSFFFLFPKLLGLVLLYADIGEVI